MLVFRSSVIRSIDNDQSFAGNKFPPQIGAFVESLTPDQESLPFFIMQNPQEFTTPDIATIPKMGVTPHPEGYGDITGGYVR